MVHHQTTLSHNDSGSLPPICAPSAVTFHTTLDGITLGKDQIQVLDGLLLKPGQTRPQTRHNFNNMYLNGQSRKTRRHHHGRGLDLDPTPTNTRQRFTKHNDGTYHTTSTDTARNRATLVHTTKISRQHDQQRQNMGSHLASQSHKLEQPPTTPSCAPVQPINQNAIRSLEGGTTNRRGRHRRWAGCPNPHTGWTMCRTTPMEPIHHGSTKPTPTQHQQPPHPKKNRRKRQGQMARNTSLLIPFT